MIINWTREYQTYFEDNGGVYVMSGHKMLLDLRRKPHVSESFRTDFGLSRNEKQLKQVVESYIRSKA